MTAAGKRRQLLIALVIFSLGAFVWGACAAPSGRTSRATCRRERRRQQMPGDAGAQRARGDRQPPRLRQYFPETLYWLPELETDAEGRAEIDVPIADSITTWRISLLASDADGNLGSAQSGCASSRISLSSRTCRAFSPWATRSTCRSASSTTSTSRRPSR
jgi:CD109 antigen